MKTKTIRQTASFKANPHDVYETLMDAGRHASLTGGSVKMGRKAGDKFSVYDGEIQGVNLELVADKKIVQSWRYSNWPAGHYSRATFMLDEVPGGTRLTFTQSGVPEEFFEDIRQGWRDYYWAPMKELLANK